MAAASQLVLAVLPVASLAGTLGRMAAGLLLFAVLPAVLAGADTASTSFFLSAGQLTSVVGLCDLLLLLPAFSFADIERIITDAPIADATADAALANDSMLWLTFMPGGLPARVLLLPPMLTPNSLPLLLEDPGLPLCLLLGLLLLLLFDAAAGSEAVASGLLGLPGLPLPAVAAPDVVAPEKETDKPLDPWPVLLLRPLLAASALLLLAAVAPVVIISLRRLTRNQPLPPVCMQSRAYHSSPSMIGKARWHISY
jgi:hypothetical protein